MVGPKLTYIEPEDNKNSLINEDSFIPSNSTFKEPLDESLSIREQALDFFKDVIGNEDIKENLFRALLQDGRIINTILVGPAATSKTMLCKIIENKTNGCLFFDATASTGAGLIELLRRNQDAKILIIDEISEMKKNDIDTLRGLLNDNRISKTLKSQFINFRMKNKLRIIATTNNPTKLSLPIKSRFQMYLINPYSDSEFIKVMEFCLLKQNIVDNELMAKELAFAMLHYKVTNIRTALSICSLIHKNDKHDDIRRIIENYLSNDASKININYNEQEV